MRALFACAVIAAVVGLGVYGCNPNSIGRPCVNPAGSAPLGTQVSSPALECPSRLCLLQPLNAGNDAGTQGARATCTASCDTNDDCDPETTSQCHSGFVCAVAVQAGNFCCRKLCICREDLVQGVNVNVDGGVITPFSCDPKLNPMPTCPNVHK
jgi:hypothetical protein